jgi:hypothetical protein
MFTFELDFLAVLAPNILSALIAEEFMSTI